MADKAYRIRAIANQFNKMVKNPDSMPYWKAALVKAKVVKKNKQINSMPSEITLVDQSSDNSQNDLVVYVLYNNMCGPNDEFVGGEYLCVFIFPDDYPLSPPEFQFYTDTGVFEPGQHPCVSIGNRHKEGFAAAGGMFDFIREIGNGIIAYEELSGGQSIIQTTVRAKKEYAAMSKMFNAEHYQPIIDLINEQYSNYSSTWKK